MDETVYDAAWGDAQIRLYLDAHAGQGGEYPADLDHLMQLLDQVPDAEIMLLLGALGMGKIHTGGMSNRFRLRRWLDKASRLLPPAKREEVQDGVPGMREPEGDPSGDVGDAGSAPL